MSFGVPMRRPAGGVLTSREHGSYIASSYSSLVDLKRSILDDPVVATDRVASLEDYDRLRLYVQQLWLVRQVPIESTPWEKDELENLYDRLHLGLQQAI
ncbi:hypothetical protein KXX35_009941, partial [Aspergillus fumigatus]